MPRLPSEINIVIIEHRQDPNSAVTQDLRVRRHYVQRWLAYLKLNSEVPGYRNMILSDENLAALPEDGVPVDLPTVIDPNLDLNVYVRDENEQNLEDNDDNPASDTGVYFPPNDLAVGTRALEEIFEGLRSSQQQQSQLVLEFI